MAVEAILTITAAMPAVTVKREDILPALREASKVASVRSGLPILTCVRLRADATTSTISVEGTDLETFYRRTVPAWVTAEGVVCLPAKDFLALVNKAPKGADIAMHEAEPGRLMVNIGTRAVTLVTYPTADFPTTPALGHEWAHASAGTIRSDFADIARCASADEGRPVLCGVLFERNGATVDLAATDSYRLGLIKGSMRSYGPTGTEQLIIPGRALALFASTIPAKTQDVAVLYHNDHQATLQHGRVTITTRVIEGRFPDYKQLMPGPGTTKTEIRADVAAMIGAAESAGTLVKANGPVKVQTDGAAVRMLALASGQGDVAEALTTCTATGDDILVGFNPRFLADGLKFPGSQVAAVRLIDAGRPATITAPGTGNRTYLLMPVRLWS